jgi:hypothetical protein
VLSMHRQIAASHILRPESKHWLGEFPLLPSWRPNSMRLLHQSYNVLVHGRVECRKRFKRGAVNGK